MAKIEQEDLWCGLMAKAQEGDAVAYQELLRDIYPVIRRFLIRKLGPLGAQEDVVQECVIAVHKARHTFDPKRPFTPWLFAVVRYRSIDFLRKAQKQWEREVSNDDYIATFEAPTTNTLLEDESTSLVRQALESLPEDMQRAVTLTKIEGLSTKEAAEKEGLSTVALRTRVSRAYKLLRKKLEKEIVHGDG